jgi:hypothetical protein
MFAPLDEVLGRGALHGVGVAAGVRTRASQLVRRRTHGALRERALREEIGQFGDESWR